MTRQIDYEDFLAMCWKGFENPRLAQEWQSSIPLEVLIKGLYEKKRSIFTFAVDVLSVKTGQEVDQALLEVMAGPDIWPRYLAVSVFSKRKSTSEEIETALLKALSDDCVSVRQSAAAALSERSGERIDKALIMALSDDDCDVRQSVVKALSVRPGEAIDRALSDALSDEEPFIRQEIVRVLSIRPSEIAAQGLLKAVGDNPLGYNNIGYRAEEVLLQRESELSDEVLISLLGSNVSPPYDGVILAAKILSHRQTSAITKAFIRAIYDVNIAEVKISAIENLSRQTGRVVERALIYALSINNFSVRKVAAKALSGRQSKVVHKALMKVIADDSYVYFPEVRHAAFAALYSTQSKKIINALNSIFG